MVTIAHTAEKLEKIVQKETRRFTTKDDFNKRMAKLTSEKVEITGGELMTMSLEALAPENPGVRNAAGHHGGAILPFYEHFTQSSLHENYVHVPHEQVAGFIAKGFANVDGDAGVAIATSGPGATNLITPFYDSHMDSVPLVFITGNVPTTSAGSMAFQEAPIKEMAGPVAKKVRYITKTEEIPRTFYNAFKTATTGRPGPVWIDVPKDVQLGKASRTDLELAKDKESIINMNSSHGLKEVGEMLEESERPVIYAGGGVKSAKAWEGLREFAMKYDIPVTTTLKGKGVFPETHDLSLQMLGMHGTVHANYAVDDSDFLLAIGARFDDRVTGDPNKFAKDAYIAHIDVDPNGIGPDGRHPELTVLSDAKNALNHLNNMHFSTKDYSEWHGKIRKWKNMHPMEYDREADVLKPQRVIEALYELSDGQHSIVADVGQHQMWAAQHYLMDDPRGFDTSGGSGTMGCSLAQALGSYMKRKDAGDNTPVSVICGDESFMMNPNTLELYRRLQPNIKVFVIDNKEEDGTPGGMVRQWYDQVHDGAENNVEGAQRIVSISKGFGVPSSETSRPEGAYSEIERALNMQGPYVVNLRVDPSENCLPMMPPGGTVEDIITYQDQ